MPRSSPKNLVLTYSADVLGAAALSHTTQVLFIGAEHAHGLDLSPLLDIQCRALELWLVNRGASAAHARAALTDLRGLSGLAKFRRPTLHSETVDSAFSAL